MNNAMPGKTGKLVTCEQQKRLFKMKIKTKPYVTKSIGQWFSHNT